MFRKLDQSSGNCVGFLAIGNIEKDDFAFLSNEVQTIIDEFGTARLLIDFQQYVSEYFSAWSADLKFSYKYHSKIEKMAVVGDREWQKTFTSQAEPFYAKETMFFGVLSRSFAWEWLRKD